MTRTRQKPLLWPTISESSRAAILEFSAHNQTQDNPGFRHNDQMLAQEWALDGADASQRNVAAGGSRVVTVLGLREGHSSPGLANQVRPSKIGLSHELSPLSLLAVEQYQESLMARPCSSDAGRRVEGDADSKYGLGKRVFRWIEKR